MWQQFVENTNVMNYNNICVWSGRYGDFWGCTGYPDGRYTEKQRRKIKDERLR
jgi:ssDNA-binding Zn-finger/Zn-ribbon topoisomerase 1